MRDVIFSLRRGHHDKPGGFALAWWLLAMVLAWAIALPAGAQSARSTMGLTVTLPNGFASVAADDMLLKSTAGDVRWGRRWNGQEWRFNQQWESLSQSWRNLTGSQAADTTGSGNAGSSAGSGGNCWVTADDDWQPPAPVAGVAAPLLPQRSTPFNRAMSVSGSAYPAAQRVLLDFAALCPGVQLASVTADVEAFRRGSGIYAGDGEAYSYSNRYILRKQAVNALPAVAASNPYAELGKGQISLAPAPVANGFRWQDRGGGWIHYDNAGRAVAEGDRNDNTVWLQRDADGVLRGVVDANGRVLYTLHYTGELLTEVKDYPIAGNSLDLPARSVRYAYDASNRLSTVTDVRGNVTRYEYDTGNHIIRITDPEGRAEQMAYKGDTVLKRTAPDGAVTDYSFDFDNVNKQFVARITGPQTEGGRRVEDHTHNRAGQLVGRVANGPSDVRTSYDTATRTTTTVNARGFTTRTTRNEFDQIVETVLPDGAVTKNSYSAIHLGLTESTDELGIKMRYQLDARGNLLRKTEAVGTAAERITDYNRNQLGQIVQTVRRGRVEAIGPATPDASWQIEYDASGQISKTTDPEGHIRQYTYNRRGDLVRFVDGRGHATQYDVDAAGNLLNTTDALARTKTYAYDKVGNLVRWVDARSKVTQAGYDALNRRTSVTSALGGVYRVRYNAEGFPVDETDEDGRTSHVEFDNFLRISKQIDALGNVTEYAYNQTEGSPSALGSLADPTEIKYPSFTQRQRFDARERPVSQTLLNPNSLGTEGLVSSTKYNARGQVIEQTDANGKTWFYAWDALGQLLETTDSLGNKTRATYDARGNLIAITDAKGNVNRFEFDRNDRVVKEVLPLGQTTTYVHDATGNVIERTDPNGHIAQYSFDAVSRLTQARLTKADGSLQRTIAYTFDAADNLTAWTDTDHPRNQTSRATSTYDDLNRKTAEIVTYPGGYTFSHGYAYSAASKKIQLIWPDGSIIGYGYSPHGELESVTIPGEGSISINHFKWLEPAKLTLPGGTVQERTLDGLLYLESLKVKTPDQQTVLNLANTYGRVQELKASNRTDTAGSASSTLNRRYDYDDEVRLVRAATDSTSPLGNEIESFTLDAVGNRVAHSRVSGQWIYDANNRLTQRGSGPTATTYQYDDAGNLTRKIEGANATQYSYDALNRLSEVRDGTNQLIARYGYDPIDRRLWKEQFRDRSGQALSQAIRTYYIYADEGLIGEATQAITLNPDDTITATATPAITTQYGPKPDAEFTTGMLFIKARNSNGQDSVGYLHHDHLGTPVMATDKAGQVIWAAAYNPFGQASIVTPAATPTKPTITSTLRLPGQVEDSETGLHYNYRRYYDPQTGRYVTVDPIGLAGGANLYKFAEADPINLTDPTGECPICAAFAACMARCMLWDGGLALLTGDCFDFGDSAKDCARDCALGFGLGAAFKAFKKFADKLPCAVNSFPAETLVHVKPKAGTLQDAQRAASAFKAIGEIEIGDEVLAFSEWKWRGSVPGRDNRLSYEKVTNIFVSSYLQKLVYIELNTGQTLSVTQGHPFLTIEGWRDAIQLRKGGQLLLRGLEDDPAIILDIKTKDESVRVFNLEVGRAHTYFVGQDGTLVHNAKCGSGKSPIGRRIKLPTKKEAYEGAKRAGGGREPRHDPAGSKPHYHPDVPQPKDWTPKAPNPHDHYYYPK